MYLTIVLLLVFVAVFSSLMTQGFWSNTVTLINAIFSALVATNYYEPVADFLEKQESSWTYAWDFIAIWVLFGLTFLIMRMATDFVSQVKVRFFIPIEKAGGIVMAIWVGWIMVCFTTMTLHTAPLARNFLGGAFQRDPDAKMLFGLGPDRIWLGWVHRESAGTFSRPTPAPFDADGGFIYRYANRRDEFDKQLSFLKSVPKN